MSITPNLCCDETEPRSIHSHETFLRITPLSGAKPPRWEPKLPRLDKFKKVLVGPWYQAVLGEKVI